MVVIVLFFKIVIGFCLFCLAFHYLTRKYLNPYKLIMIFGKKGSGKSTLLTKLAINYQKKGIPVFSTEEIQGCYRITYADIGYTEFPPESVILLDEASMVWDNRDFKSFDKNVRNWFRLQRHRHITVYLFSQTFDIDKKLRDLTDEMYLVEKKLRVFSYAKRILKRTVLNKSSAESPSKLDEDLVFDSILFFWCGSRRLTFIPAWAKYFDSFVADPLKEKEFEQVPIKIPVKRGSFLQSLRARF